MRADRRESARGQAFRHAEKSSVAVHRSKVQSLDVIKGDRRVDEESKQARSDEVPECNRKEKVDGPLVFCDPMRLLCRLRETKIVPRFIADGCWRYNLKCAEDRSEANDGGCRSGEVQVMKCADDSAGEKDRR